RGRRPLHVVGLPHPRFPARLRPAHRPLPDVAPRARSVQRRRDRPRGARRRKALRSRARPRDARGSLRSAGRSRSQLGRRGHSARGRRRGRTRTSSLRNVRVGGWGVELHPGVLRPPRLSQEFQSMQRLKTIFVLGASVLVLGTTIVLAGAMQPCARAEPQLEIAKIYWEYNSSANDLGVQVSLDGEDWKTLKIENPDGKVIFDVRGKGPYKQRG